MRAAARSLLLLTILAVLFACASASADTLRLDDVGLRFDTLEGESCLDRGMQDGQAQALLGVSADIALEGMRRDHSYLLILSGDRQVSLCVTDVPDFIQKSDVSELDESERGLLMDWLVREHAANKAEWSADMPDYAVLECDAHGAIAMNTLCMETLYLGKLFSYRLDVLGRELTAEDRETLLSVASRMLRLGLARDEWHGELDFRFPQSKTENNGSALTPLSAPVLTTENAEMTADNADVTLSLDPVPATVPTNTVTVNGTTDPKAKLRIRVNGDASSAFSPDLNGAFSVTGRKLKNRKKNDIEIIASLDGMTTTIAFEVMADMQPLPFALSTTRATTTEDRITIEGVTLPGANVQVARGGVKGGAEVDEEGRFSFTVNTKKNGNFPFKIEASLLGYKTVKQTGKVTRGEVKAPSYKKLVKSPKSYASTDISLTGTVTELRYENGTPKCVLETPDGAYLLHCQSLLDIETGMALGCEGQLLGANEDYQGQACPAVRVLALTD